MTDVFYLSPEAFRPKALCCMEEYCGLSEHQSLCVCLYHKGNLYFFGKPGEETRLQYDVGSLSKTVTAHLILSLQEKGLLSLEDPVDRYLEVKPGSYPTLYQLLTHTAGYGPLTPLEITLPALLKKRYVKANPYEHCTPKQVLAALQRRRGKKKTRYAYSDFAYAVLALVAERLTGVPFGDLLGDFCQNTLGLKTACIHGRAEDRRPPAVHKGKIIPFWHWGENNPYLASGGLVMTPMDLLSYLRLQIESEEPFIITAHTPCRHIPKGKTPLVPCIGWRSYRNSHRLWHVGGVGSFRSSLVFNRQTRFGVAVLGNSKGKKHANVHHLAKLLYSELKVKKVDFSTALERNTR